MDPYFLPCGHSFCLTPCIVSNDRDTEVTCPTCKIKCSVKNLTPDKDRCAGANAYMVKQSLCIQSPVYSIAEYPQNVNISPYQRGGIPTEDFFQQPQISPRIPRSNSFLPVSQPRECELCHSMVFGLIYYSALKVSICAECRDKKFNELVDQHLGKIHEIKRFDKSLVRLEECLRKQRSSGSSSTIEKELDEVISYLFKILEESRNKAETELQTHNMRIEKWLREMHEKLIAIAPGILQVPTLVEDLEINGAGVDKWLKMQNNIIQTSKAIAQVKEGMLMRGTEKYEFNPEGQKQIMKALEQSNLISTSSEDYSGLQNSHYSSTDFTTSSRSRSPQVRFNLPKDPTPIDRSRSPKDYCNSPRDLPPRPTANISDLFS
nr:expressed protein [Hymenolepis microstoma]